MHPSLSPRRLRCGILGLVLGLWLTSSPADTLGNDPAIDAFASTLAARHGFDANTLRTELADIEPNETVLQAIRPAATAERKSWQRYRSRFLTPQRIGGGQHFWQAHQEELTRAEKQYGVPAEIIVAIIGVETEYGRNTGRFNALQALATLAFRYPPRAEFFREELEQLYLLAREQTRPAGQFESSYAGAIGIPQFMPGSVRRYAVDFDGDGQIDLHRSHADAIGSVAAFLAAHGWERGAPIVVPALLGDADPAPLVEAGIRPSFERQQLAAMGLDVEHLAESGRFALIDLVTPDAATEYWWGYPNFYAITRYNRSNSYAMAVTQLAEAIREAQTQGVTPPAPRKKAAKAGSRVKRRRGG